MWKPAVIESVDGRQKSAKVYIIIYSGYFVSDCQKMALAIDSLNLWVEQTIALGKIDKTLLDE